MSALRLAAWLSGLLGLSLIGLAGALVLSASPGASLAAELRPHAAADLSDDDPVLDRVAAAADIRTALARAEAIHPRLYWRADRAVVLARAEALIGALPARPHAMDVYRALSEIIGLLGDGHVYLDRPPAGPGEDALAAWLARGGRLLALAVRPDENGLVVTRSAVDGVAAGDHLLRINGQAAGVLFARAVALSSGEAELQRREAELGFADRLWDLGVRPPYVLDGRFAGQAGERRLAGGVPADESAARSTAGSGVALDMLPGGIALVAIDRLTAERSAFRQRLASVFSDIARAGTRGLILDLRRNPGGNTLLADDVVSYVSDRPFRLFARVTARASAECRAFLPGSLAAGGAAARAVGGMQDGETRSWDLPMHAPPATPLRFTGPVAVLIGPGTFSAANALANAIGDFHLATLVGHDTAEIPNNFGNTCPVTLPATRMVLNVPSATMVRANGDAASMEDVHPDIYTPAAAGTDVAVARAWIADQLAGSASLRVSYPVRQP